MEKKFPLGNGQGTLTLREGGGQVQCRAELRDDGQGLYKAWLEGAGGRLCLGALLPGGGTLALERTLFRQELERKGVWPVLRCWVELAYSPQRRADRPQEPPGWDPEPRPGRLMGDALLAGSAARLERALVRQEEGGFRLAVPWQAGGPFPMTPVFCFARVERLGGEHCAVFSFDQAGYPRF